MKRKRKILLILWAFFGLLFPKQINAQTDNTKIAIVQLVSHPSLNAINEGIKEGVAKIPGDHSFEIVDYNAEGDMNLLNTLAKQVVQGQPDYIFAITTPVAQALQNETKEIPIIMAGITDPLAAKLVSNLEKPGENISGVSDFLAPKVQFEFIKDYQLQIRKIGMIYSTSEDNSKEEIEQASKAAEALGFSVQIEGLNSTNDMPLIADRLASSVDAVYIGSDNTVASTFTTLVEVTDRKSIPVFTPVAPMIEQGALAGVAIDQKDIGIASVEFLDQIINQNKNIGDLSIKYMDNYQPIINKEVEKLIIKEVSEKENIADKSFLTYFSTSQWSLYINAIIQGILWGIMGLGLFITFRVLKFADLTSEASFTIGAATTVSLLNHGVNPILAMLIAVLMGSLAGLLTACLMNYLDLPGLLASIISLTALYSINLRIMGFPNLSLRGIATVFDIFEIGFSKVLSVFIIGGLLVIVLILLMSYFFKTDLGQALVATGDNPTMAKSLGIKTVKMKTLALMIANGLIALCGALVSQNNGFADISMGTGTVVIALASIVIGEVMINKEISLSQRLMAIILGSVIYQLILAFVLQLGFHPNDFKLISAAVLAIFIALPKIKALALEKNNRKLGRY